ncbi:MAG: 2-oxoacid:ferredoxin oxidoreductase subunit alpha [Nitrospirae bacterium GWC2_57_9]|nr:MAG: 2-oxoacid:ferredoxin oxidoreductase subunit alpha [Nitrospirae bacterium GWC2_57_9]
MDYTIKIGGEAGQGIQTIGDTLARIFVRAGYHVFTHQDYESRIRGGHNFYQIRLSERPVSASREKIDILVALDLASITLHKNELAGNGRIVYDSASVKAKQEGQAFFDIPFVDLAVKSGGQRIMENTVATGAVLGMLGMKVDYLFDNLAETFRKKGDAIIDANKKAARAGYDFALQNCSQCSFRASGANAPGPLMLVSGVEAIGLGALASGCKFYAAYPMTPSTGIMNYLASKEREYGVVVEQAEDEISAINMAIGASFAGVRSMTGTSGGGFALMVEGLSLAGMTETPIVIGMGQRPGPATGFPTRTEQGELQFLISAGHGEFPRVIFAPGSPKQAFHAVNKAFDIAEKYQIPAFVLFDTYLADSTWTLDGIDADRILYTDYRLRGEAFSRLSEYKRHAFTESGVSPLAVPGDAKHVVVTDSDEHDEDGHIIEDAPTRVRMVQKRLHRKLPAIRREIASPFVYGSPSPEVVLAGWGSLYGIMKEAVDALSKSRSIAMLHFSEVYPLPDILRFDYLQYLNQAKKTICVEQNATGQFERLVKAETGYEFSGNIRKYDGRPFLLEELVREIEAKIKK